MPSMSVTLSLAQFHFLEPLWLLALVPLALIYWLTVHKKASGSDWNKVIDAHLLPTLLKINPTKIGKSFSALLMLAWMISVLALANPAWEKIAVPVFQTNMARVIVLDLSLSMNIADVKPSRLARAKFKIEDILAKNEEGQIGLVVFAGDAFTVTPLTRDADTIGSMLSSLSPDIMPVQGSRADLGLLKAQELLQQAGVPNGQVLLMADGAEAYLALEATEELSKNDYAVSVLSLGTQQGGTIPNVVGRDRKPI
ncbi:MAG: VWA domain-containing protein, partial [Thiotrichaceae bacterium]